MHEYSHAFPSLFLQVNHKRKYLDSYCRYLTFYMLTAKNNQRLGSKFSSYKNVLSLLLSSIVSSSHIIFLSFRKTKKMNSKRVEFRTADGVMLRGDYYPVEIQNAPVIIMTQGVRSPF